MIQPTKWKKFSAVSTLVLIYLMAGCGNHQAPLVQYGPVVQQIMITDTAVFRTFSLGNKPEEVKKRETALLMESDSSFLYYESKKSDSSSFNVMYNFDEEGLAEIQSDIYLSNATQGDEAFEQFKKYFNDHYGESTAKQGYMVWTIPSSKFGTVRVNLDLENADGNISKAHSKISLWIYVDKDDKN